MRTEAMVRAILRALMAPGAARILVVAPNLSSSLATYSRVLELIPSQFVERAQPVRRRIELTGGRLVAFTTPINARRSIRGVRWTGVAGIMADPCELCDPREAELMIDLEWPS